MEKGRGSWMAHGAPRRGVSKQESLQPDEARMREMFLNLMAIAGFLFLALILLHVFYGFANDFTFRVYVALFVILECAVISIRLYLYLRKRMARSQLPDLEKNIQNFAKQNPHLAFSTSYESIGSTSKSKEYFHQKRNSF